MNRADIQKYFHSRADFFDSHYAGRKSLMRYFDQLFRKGLYERYYLVFERSGNVTGKTILDIGCGSGRYAIEFAKRGASKVVGIDFAADMLAIARKLAKENNLEDVCRFIEADFINYDFGKQRFDISVAIGFFEYLKEPKRYLSKIIKLTGEKIIISLPRPSLIRMPIRKLRYYLIKHCPVYFYSKKKIARLLQAVGNPNYKLIKYRSGGYLLEINL